MMPNMTRNIEINEPESERLPEPLTQPLSDKVEAEREAVTSKTHGANVSVRSIGVLTSGGDAPGMNAAIRAVVRAGINHGYQMYGVRRGYHGLWRGDIIRLDGRSVSEKLQRGGTFLMTARSATFATEEGVKQAYEMAKVFGLDVLVVIGGDGSFMGAKDLAEAGLPVIGIPATIDNDISATEYTIGFDTAMNTAMDAIDKIKDTGSSHERCSVIEVMGRDAGYIAMNVGISTGAEVILLPEMELDFNRDVVRRLLECRNSGKSHYVVIVAEGVGSSIDIAKEIEERTGIESRASVLGYMQRGGSPTLRDRLLASLMGVHAVECINEDKLNRLVVLKQGTVTDVDIHEGLAMRKDIDTDHIHDAKIIAI